MQILPESKIQQSIVNDFHNNYCREKHNPQLIIYSVPNGIPVPLPKDIRARALDLLHKTGMLNGASDLVIQGVNGRVLNVEVKAETKQSPAQKDFQKRVETLGGRYIIVYSLLDFQNQLKTHLPWLQNKL